MRIAGQLDELSPSLTHLRAKVPIHLEPKDRVARWYRHSQTLAKPGSKGAVWIKQRLFSASLLAHLLVTSRAGLFPRHAMTPVPLRSSSRSAVASSGVGCSCRLARPPRSRSSGPWASPPPSQGRWRHQGGARRIVACAGRLTQRDGRGPDADDAARQRTATAVIDRCLQGHYPDRPRRLCPIRTLNLPHHAR